MDGNTITLDLKNPVDLMVEPGEFHKISKLQLGYWYPVGTNGEGNTAVAVPLFGGDVFIWIEVDGKETDIVNMMSAAFGEKPSDSDMKNRFSL